MAFVGFRMSGPECATCCHECDIATDDFNRADETPVASPWTKLTGTNWNLAGNLLDAVAAATYRHNTVFPGAADDYRYASVRVTFSVSGGAEVLTGMTDENNYYAASINFQSADCSVLSATMVTAGVGAFGGGCVPGPSVYGCVNLPGLEAGDEVLLEVCLKPQTGSYSYATYDTVIAKATLPNGKIYSATLIQDGPTVGDYSGLRATAAMEFDDFKAKYHRNSPEGEHRTCPNCNTPCLIGSDDFATAVDCTWDTLAGTYNISGGILTFTADDSAIQFNQFHPGLKHAQIITGRLGYGAIHRGFLGSVYFEWDGVSEVRLYDRDSNLLDSDEDDPISLVPDADGMLNFQFCQNENGTASIIVTDNSGHYICAASDYEEVENGYWASLGGDDGATFKDFEFQKGYSTEVPTDTGCDQCYCQRVCSECLNDTAPSLWQVFIPDDVEEDPDGGCPICELFKGTSIAAEDIIDCLWGYTLNGDFCTTSLVIRTLSVGTASWDGSSPATYRVQVSLTTFDLIFGAGTLYWEADYGLVKPDCISFIDEEIPYAGRVDSGAACVSGTGLPVLLTALA